MIYSQKVSVNSLNLMILCRESYPLMTATTCLLGEMILMLGTFLQALTHENRFREAMTILEIGPMVGKAMVGEIVRLHPRDRY